MKKFDVGHFSDSEGKSEENLPDPDKLRSFEAEALVECLERAKSSLSGISQSAKQLFSDDAGTLLATERMDISSLDLENLKKASNEENFYFPLLSADLRKKEFASVEIRRDKKLILDSIKQDLVELAIRLSEVSPILSELMTGIPSSISKSLKLFSTSQRRNWLTENSFSLKVHPLAKLIEFKDKNSFFNYLYQYIALNSKTQYKPLSSVGESLEIFQSNVLNTNYADPDDSFFRSDTSLYNASISGLATLVSVSWYMHKRPASKDARRLLCGKFGESARRMPLAAGYALCITVFCSTANAPGDRTSGLWSRFFPQDLVEGGVELVNHLGRDSLAQLAKQLV